MAVDRIVNDIIINAYRLVGNLDPNGEVPGYKVNEALYLLNELLDELSSFADNIPVFDILTFNLEAGKDQYTIGDNATDYDIESRQISVLNDAYFLEASGQIRRLTILPYAQLYQDGRPIINARPTEILHEKFADYSRITVFPIPAQSYVCKLRIKKYFSDLEIQRALTGLPVFYHRYLRYALARELEAIGKLNNWTPTLEQEYNRLFMMIHAKGGSDLAIKRRVDFDQENYHSRGYRYAR